MTLNLEYLLSLDPIYRSLCGFLNTRDRLSILNISKLLQETLSASPSTWQHLDFSGRSRDVVMYYLRNDGVPGALQELILDCTDVNEMTMAVILLRCPHLRMLGLGGATELLDGVVASILAARRNGHVLKLQFVGILGAPHFKTTGINTLAASLNRDFEKLGIETDLVKCPEEHAFTSDDDHWHLCTAKPPVCTVCQRASQGCYPCLNGRTCRGCFKFWCFDCESPITRVCYECGHSCTACKQGIYVKCSECNSMFCKLHRDEPRTSRTTTGRRTGLESSSVTDSNWCDWCIQGRCQGFGS